MATILLFDVNETLLDMSALDPAFQSIFGDVKVRALWFENVLHTSVVLNQIGRYLEFAELSASSLEVTANALKVKLGPLEKTRIMSAIKKLPAHPEVPEALALLKKAGFRLATLSNSSEQAVRAQLAQNGIEPLFEAILSTDAVQKFKPAPETYLYAANQFGVPIGSICMIAAHSWDTAGATHVGANVALVNRGGMSIDHLLSNPHFQAENLLLLAHQLISQRAALNQSGMSAA